ncbi:MAG: HAD-IB family phosphatase [Bacillota bacterium]
MAKVEWTCLFDLDGTITRKEILPEIAREVGIYDEIRELTAQTIQGLIPFHESFLRRVEMFRSIPIQRVREIVAEVPLHEEIVEFMRENAHRSFIVTGNLDVWVAPLCERIGARYYTSVARTDNGYVTGVLSVLEKGRVPGLFTGPVVAVGEGNNDADMIRNASIGIGFGGVHPPAASVMAYATHAIYEEGSLCRFLRQLS